MVPSIIDVWGYDREFCSSSSSSSSSTNVTQKLNRLSLEILQEYRYPYGGVQRHA